MYRCVMGVGFFSYSFWLRCLLRITLHEDASRHDPYSSKPAVHSSHFHLAVLLVDYFHNSHVLPLLNRHLAGPVCAVVCNDEADGVAVDSASALRSLPQPKTL